MAQRPISPKGQKSTVSRTNLGEAAILLTFFLGYFLYVCLRLQPAVEYFAGGPFFYYTAGFLRPFLRRPGGLIEYAAAFVAQVNASDWLGALVSLALAGALWIVSAFVLRRISGERSWWAAMAPVFLLIVLRNLSGGAGLAASLGLLLGVGAAAGYATVGLRDGWGRLATTVPLAAGLMYVAGPWSAGCFALFVGCAEATRQNKWAASLGPVLVGVAVIGGGTLLGRGPVGNLFQPVEDSTAMWGLVALYLSVPGLALLLRLISVGRASPPASTAGGARKPAATPRPAGFQRLAVKRTAAVILCAGGCVLVGVTLEPYRQSGAEVAYYTYSEQYQRALGVARVMPRVTSSTQVWVRLALYHTGQLGDELFAYPIQPGSEPLPGLSGGLLTCRPQSRTLLELGLVSDAEHLAHEAWETEGDRPDLLAALAEVNVLKNRPAAARMFLNVLQRGPCFCRASRAEGQGAATSPVLPANAELDLIRSRMPTNDLPHEGLTSEELLSFLLRANPTNQMAFEYLMAHYLMTLDLKKAVDNLWRLDHFNYSGFPRSYEEALLLYERVSGNHVQLKGRQVRPETAQRFQQFEAVAEQPGLDPRAKWAALARDFGDTYWYYFYVTQSQAKADSGKPAAS